MYVLINTETTEVEKFDTLEDMLVSCIKKKPTKATASGATAPVPIKTSGNEYSLLHETMIARDNLTIEKVQGKVQVSAEEAFTSTYFPEVLTDKEIAEEKQDHSFNEMELKTRFDSINIKRSSELIPFTRVKNLYDTDFVVKYVYASTTQNRVETNFARAAWKLYLQFPILFGADPDKYKDLNSKLCLHTWGNITRITDVDTNGNPIQEEDGKVYNYSILRTDVEVFRKFLALANRLQNVFESRLFPYYFVEELAFLSYRTHITGIIEFDFLELWIRAFLHKKTHPDKDESVKSSLLYEEFQNLVLQTFDDSKNEVYIQLIELLKEGVSQKIFSKLLKTTFSKQCQRKSDGIYWQGFRLKINTGGTAFQVLEENSKLSVYNCPDDNGDGQQFASCL